MTLAGTFPFRAGSARGRPTCAHGRRSRGKRRTRFWFVGAAASPCGRSRRMSPRRQSDPGVVVIDEAGRFAVPLLSGHLGRCERACANCGTRGGAHPRHHYGDRRPRRVGGGYVGAPCGAGRFESRGHQASVGAAAFGRRVALYSDMSISGQPPEGVDIASDRARADIVVSPFAGANAGASVRAAETTGALTPPVRRGSRRA